MATREDAIHMEGSHISRNRASYGKRAEISKSYRLCRVSHLAGILHKAARVRDVLTRTLRRASCDHPIPFQDEIVGYVCDIRQCMVGPAGTSPPSMGQDRLSLTSEGGIW